jgi:type IV secretory pathway TrbD component
MINFTVALIILTAIAAWYLIGFGAYIYVIVYSIAISELSAKIGRRSQ